MNSIERMDARLHMLTQAELIASFLQGDHGLSPEKEANWKRLLECLSKTAVCMVAMEDDMLRSRRMIDELQTQSREEAEVLGSLKTQVEYLKEENTRIKESLARAIDLLNHNSINQTELYRIQLQ